MRHWLLYRQGEYYIKSGTKSNIQTTALLQGLQVIGSVKSKTEVTAKKYLIVQAYKHFNSLNEKT